MRTSATPGRRSATTRRRTRDRPGYDIVQETWKSILGEGDFEKKWNRVLHDGLLAGSELPEVAAEPAGKLTTASFAELAGGTAAANALEIVFVASPSVHDGRF